MLTKMVLCVETDIVACGVLGLFLSDQLPGGCHSVIHADTTDLRGLGDVRVGLVYPTQNGKDGQRVAIVVLHPAVSAVEAVNYMNRPLENAVLIVTAADVQQQALEKRGCDMGMGYVKFLGERAPYTDMANTLMITGQKKTGHRWHQEIASIVVDDFLFAKIQGQKHNEHHAGV